MKCKVSFFHCYHDKYSCQIEYQRPALCMYISNPHRSFQCRSTPIPIPIPITDPKRHQCRPHIIYGAFLRSFVPSASITYSQQGRRSSIPISNSTITSTFTALAFDNANRTGITTSAHYPYSPHSPRCPSGHARSCRPGWRCDGGRSATRLPSASGCAGAWCASRPRGRTGRPSLGGRWRSLVRRRAGGFVGDRLLLMWTF